jgi:AraC family transcriptional regulator
MLDPAELPANFECVVEGHAQVSGATVEVHRYRWTSRQDAVFTPPHAFVDLALSRRAPAAAGEYVGPMATAHRRYGSIIFVPAGLSLHSQWEAGSQRSVCCELDPPIMAKLKQREWRGRDLAAGLDIRNTFIRQALQRLSAEVLCPGFADGLLIESLCTTVAIELLRYFDQIPERVAGAGGRLSHTAVERVTERIRDSRGTLPGIADLAAEHGMSARHFSRLFHRATGQTIGTYAADLKLCQAKECLAGGNIGIKEISFRCGFGSVSAFSAAFRRDVGITPRQFRNITLA